MTSSIMINTQIAHLTANCFNIFDLLLFCLRQKKQHRTAQAINVTRINQLVNINSSGVSNPKKRKSVCTSGCLISKSISFLNWFSV